MDFKTIIANRLGKNKLNKITFLHIELLVTVNNSLVQCSLSDDMDDHSTTGVHSSQSLGAPNDGLLPNTLNLFLGYEEYF